MGLQGPNYFGAYGGLARVALPLVVALPVLLSPSSSSPTRMSLTLTGAVATCDCKPEFNVTAEGPGSCVRAKDDGKWCRIKFPGASQANARKNEFDRLMQKLGLPEYDVAAAAASINSRSPEEWNLAFLDHNLPPLVAGALWDLEPQRIKPLVKALSDTKAAKRILEGWQSRPPTLVELSLHTESGGYKLAVSHGCMEFVDGPFSLLIKTSFASASKACVP